MNDVSSGIVNDTILEQEAASPQGESTDGIREGQPERHKDHPGEEVHTAKVGASNEDESDSREDKLEIDHRRLWKVLGNTSGRECRLADLIVHCNRRPRSSYER